MSSYKKIVVGTDGSDTSMLAVDRAGAVAADSDALLLIVSAYEPATNKGAEDLKQEAYLTVGSAPAESAVRDAEARARVRGARRVETLAVQGPPVPVLEHAVAESEADLLVVGNVGLNSLAGRLLGSVPRSVTRRAGADVLIVHTS